MQVKIGDKFRALQRSALLYTKGKIYTVTDTNKDKTQIRRDDGRFDYWDTYYFSDPTKHKWWQKVNTKQRNLPDWF